MTGNKEKLIIYQVFPRILTNSTTDCEPSGTYERNGCGKFNDFTPRLIESIKQLGINTIWLTGVIEHATKTAFPECDIPADNPYIVKGEAGSPYAIKDYYDVAPSLACDPAQRMEEFEALIDRIHSQGLKLILDFVPNHTARAYHSDCAPANTPDFGENDNRDEAFSPLNNYYYFPGQHFEPDIYIGEGTARYNEFPAKATGNDCFSPRCGEYDWYETVKLNYGINYLSGENYFNPIPDTWLKMRDILLFWLSKGVDGFRCDMVFMVPLEFWHWALHDIKKEYPKAFFIGEIYDISLYRPFLDYGGFDYLYDKVGLYDTLVGIDKLNYSAARLTGCWQAVDGIGSRMLNFLENHDEVRYASEAYSGTGMDVEPALVVSAMISTGPFMIYYGQELGESGEENEGFAGRNHRSTIFDYWSYDKLRRWNNSGLWNRSLLSEDENNLRELYSKVLHLCNESSAIREGGFFDLMYANYHHGGLDTHSIFAFLRHSAEEALLIIANFSRENRYIRLCIPEAAFIAAGISEGRLTAEDLLTGDGFMLELSRSHCAEVKVDARKALVLKVRGGL